MPTIKPKTVEAARYALLEMVRLYGHDTAVGWVRSAMNCADADIDHEGDVYVAEPMPGQWIRERGLIDLVNKIREGR